MYPYHNRIKQRIRRGELIGYAFVDDYPGIGEALVLKFSTYPPQRPIRPNRYVEYIHILADWHKSWEKGEKRNAESVIPEHNGKPNRGIPSEL